jgi:aspartyl-tRNA(Asn)/glutamyl-tRNA(Gln) amidotransferase subunit A
LSDTELLLKPTAELGRMIAIRQLSPVELAAATLRQIERTQPALNAYADVYADELMRSAADAEKEISPGNYRGPLHGIPIGLKDLIDVRDKVTAAGSAVLEGRIAPHDATVVQRLRSAGAIVTGKLNLYEFAFGISSVNAHTGDVRNPWNVERMTAGSSSGSAAAVASGSAAMALGTDTGGSIRMPAAACGITGFKPTYGIVPRTGVLDLSWSQDHVGPMCRTAEDCGLMMDVIAGHDSADPASAARRLPGFTSELERGLKGIRLGIPSDYFFDRIDPEIHTAVATAIDTMRHAGAKLVEVAMPWVSAGRSINVAILIAEAFAAHEKQLETNGYMYSDAVRNRLLDGSQVTAADYIHAQRARAKFCHQMAEAMANIDVLVTPTVPVQTPTLASVRPTPDNPTPSAGREFPVFTGAFDVTGQPSLSMNCGFTTDGMPIGLMLSGKAFDDACVLGVAHAFQQISDWSSRVPPVCV